MLMVMILMKIMAEATSIWKGLRGSLAILSKSNSVEEKRKGATFIRRGLIPGVIDEYVVMDTIVMYNMGDVQAASIWGGLYGGASIETMVSTSVVGMEWLSDEPKRG